MARKVTLTLEVEAIVEDDDAKVSPGIANATAQWATMPSTKAGAPPSLTFISVDGVSVTIEAKYATSLH